MNYEALEKQIRTIPKEYIFEIAEFIDLLKYKIMVQKQGSVRPLRKLGGYEGQIKIADNFDKTPEGFEEYKNVHKKSCID